MKTNCSFTRINIAIQLVVLSLLASVLFAANGEDGAGRLKVNQQKNSSISSDQIQDQKPANISFDVFEKRLKDLIDSSFRRALPTLLRSSRGQVSFECTAGLLKLVRGIQQLQDWAIKVLDATGKPPGGILEGTLTAFGSYDECLSVLVPSKTPNQPPTFQGKYCTVQLHPPDGLFDQMAASDTGTGSDNTGSNSSMGDQPLRHQMASHKENKHTAFENIKKHGEILKHSYFRFGLCVPETCTEQEVAQLLQTGVSKLSLKAKVRRCEIKMPFQFSNTQISLICCFSVLILLVIIGTCLDFCYNTENEDSSRFWLRLFLSFSLKSNTSSLLDTKPAFSGEVSALNGIRFITSLWIILGHNYLLPIGVQYIRYRRVLGYIDFQKEFAYAAIANFYLSVDTFFLISGLLAVYSRKNGFGKDKQSINFAGFVFKRLLRITPAYVAILGLFLLLPLIGSGPMWYDAVQSQADICTTNWWTNLLYIQNFWPIKQHCMLHSWYLACTIQIHIISFLIVWPLIRKALAGLVLNSVLLVGSIVLTGYVTYSNDLRPTLDPLGGHKALEGVTSLVYVRPYAHLPAFAVGVFYGYLIVKIQTKRFSKMILLLGCSASLALSMSVIYGLFDYYKGAPVTVSGGVIYAGVHRAVWALSVGWVILVCATGNGGFLNKFLSWKAFIPLGKLSFGAYLIHPLIILYQLGRIRERIYLGHVEMIFNTIAVSCVSYVLAWVLYTAVELPAVRLEKLLCSIKCSSFRLTRIMSRNKTRTNLVLVNPNSPLSIVEGKIVKPAKIVKPIIEVIGIRNHQRAF